MPFMRVSDGTQPVEIHYEDVGSGRPVVLIHGWPLSGRSWEPQLPALVEAGYRVVTYDRRGFGSSSQPWEGYDYDTFATDLAALLEALDLRDVVLVGFSMGGGEVARYLGSYAPDRVSGAVFAAAVPPYLYVSDDNPDGGLDDATIGEFESGVRGDRAAFLEGFTTNFFTAGDRTDLVSEPTQRYLRTVAEFASPKGTLDCIGAFGRTDFRADLAKITVPTLVIHGDSDGIVPFEVSGKRTHEAIAGSTLVVVEGAPHGLNVSHAEEFNAALLEFLGGGGTASTSEQSAPPAAPTAVAVPDDGPQPVADERAVEASDPASPPAARTPDEHVDPPAAATPDDGVPGLTWRTAEENDPANQTVDLPEEKAQRLGWTADPNLGDVPVDDQPHPGSLR